MKHITAQKLVLEPRGSFKMTLRDLLLLSIPETYKFKIRKIF